MTGHVCAPRPETVAPLKDGSRSSMRETCQVCLAHRVWIQRIDGAIVALNLEPRGRK